MHVLSEFTCDSSGKCYNAGMSTTLDDTAALSGNEIKALRAELHLSQEQLAQLLGVSFGTVNRWENGHNRPQGSQVKKLLALKSGKGSQTVKKPQFGTLAGRVPPIEDQYLVNEPDWVLDAMFGVDAE